MGIFRFIEAVSGMSANYYLKNEKTGDGIDPHVVAYSDRTSGISESYRSLAARIAAVEPRKIIFITSSLPQEGKTTTACNLAAVFASTLNEKTLLVDADLRRPRIHHLLGRDKAPGLSDILSGDLTIDEILNSSNVRELNVITSGTHSHAPEILLNSPAMGDILSDLSNRFDRIIVDTPPVLRSADFQAIGPFADYRIFIVKAGVTPEHLIKESLATLRGTKSMPDTCLLTNAERIPDYYSYITQYSYREYYSSYNDYESIEQEENQGLGLW